jgi:arginine N-succinyltransferase
MKKSRARPQESAPVGAERFLIREVETKDLEGLYALSRHLNSVNFPHDRKVLRSLIQGARASMTGKILDLTRRQYMFVLVGAESGRIAGTSMIFAQHGHPDAPHIFFDVIEDERYSATLNRHFRHTFLRLGFNYDGPTEIGALVLDPELRSFGLGKPLSFVRFLFMAMYRDLFRDSVIAELMPPLLSDGRSRLWEHVGKRFTGLTYQEADKLSHTNKEFISSLFPQDIQASLLPDDIQELIGEVGEDTKGVKRMLEATGFEYSHRIDPFDGGPHFEAKIENIGVIEQSRRYRIAKESLDEASEAQVLERQAVDGVTRMLIGVGAAEAPYKFRALPAAVRIDGDELVLTATSKKLMKLKTSAQVWAAPV